MKNCYVFGRHVFVTLEYPPLKRQFSQKKFWLFKSHWLVFLISSSLNVKCETFQDIFYKKSAGICTEKCPGSGMMAALYVTGLNHAARSKLFLSLPSVSAFECQKYILQVPAASFATKPNLKRNNFENERKREKYLLLGFLTSSMIAYYLLNKKIVFAEKAEVKTAGQFIKDLPVYSVSEIADHSIKEKKIWVTYKNGVYDITDFVKKHPGGNKILLAAGSSVEPFWSLYAVHHTPEVYQMLEEFRIGNVEVSEISEEDKFLDPYTNDPKRHPALKPASVKPYNAEPPPSLLVDNFCTPNAIFYVRNHLPVPLVDVSKYRLEIKGIGIEEKSLTLDDIKKFPKYTVSAAVQCAGNRRSEMTKVKEVKGLNWGHAAIGNATWSGARLTDVLKSCGLDLNRTDIEHVQFEGLDKGPENVPYAASIPSEKALDPKGDVILAYEMNGEPLPRDHGFPLRVIVPGVVGARNVKWVSKIILSEKESDSHWQQSDYKGFSPSTDWDTVDFKSSPAIQELPVISAICMPEEGENVEIVDGSIICKGYAWSGGGKKIVRVDVSANKGKTWHVADLEQTQDKSPRHWAWSLWSIMLPVSEKEETLEIWVKAVDSSYNTQPENFENIWNLRGVLSNAYHRIKVKIVKT